MSVRVNLLPRETFARQEAARQRLVAGLLGLVLLALLAGAYVFQLQRVGDARDELAAEEARVDELQAEVNALQEFEELQERRAQLADVITDTLAAEAGLAGILQDLAAVMPADAQVDNLGINVIDAEDSFDATTGTPTVGTLELTGKSLNSHAPGVERFLISLDKVASFVDLHVSSSSLEVDEEVDDDQTVSFNVDGQLGREVLTGRYADGLPEELR